MKELNIGQKATIKVKISPNRTISFTCEIKFIQSDRIGLIFPNEARGEACYLPEEKEIEVILYTRNGVRVFKSIIIDSPVEEDIFVIEYYEDESAIQRRMYVRVPCEFRFELIKEGKKIITKTLNISGGGIRFFINRELDLGDKWDFELYLPNWEIPIQGDGNIIYLEKMPEGMFSSVIMIDNLLESDRNKIIKTCFDLEAKAIR